MSVSALAGLDASSVAALCFVSAAAQDKPITKVARNTAMLFIMLMFLDSENVIA
jgi:hypothetical protein